ncbi:MAG: hypothetical protein AAFR79_00460 [Pseudomonadota bacterium]
MNADLAAVIEELEAVLAGMRSAAQLPEGRALTPLAERLVGVSAVSRSFDWPRSPLLVC